MRDLMRDPWTGQFDQSSVDELEQGAFLRGVLTGGLVMALVVVLTAATVIGGRVF